MSQRINNSVESVQRNDNHDEAWEIASDNSEEDTDAAGDVIGHPRDSVGPADLQRDLEKDHLEVKVMIYSWINSYEPLDLQWRGELVEGSSCSWLSS